MSHKLYDTLLEQIQTVQDETNLKDYHAFTYWFVDTVFGWEKKGILNSICDGMHDKAVALFAHTSRFRDYLGILPKYQVL